MKISMVMMAVMVGGFASAMPTQKELEDAAPVVQARLAKEKQEVADGRKTRTEVADAAVIMAASADSEAEKVLLLKGAFTFYVKDGKYDKASETLGALRIAIDRVSDETIDSLVKSVEGAVEPEDRPRFHRMMVAGLRSAKVDGVTWYYRETEKGVEIGTGLRNLAAVDERTCGRLVIPNEIHGKPVVSVGIGTLHGCTRVESVFIPKNAASVKVAAFTGCSNLQNIEIDPDNPTYRSVEGLLADKAGSGIGRCPEGRRSVTVPKGTKLIYGGAFSDCGKLESVVIPDGVTRINNEAFSRCISLTSVKMPSSVTSIGEKAFEGCDRLSPKPSVPSGSGECVVLPDIPVADDAGWRKGPAEAWFVNWNKAVAEAKRTARPLFVLKTGSDWCPWCVKLHDNVLSKPAFAEFAAKNLILVYLDNPSKSNSLCEAQREHNESLSRELGLRDGVPNATIITAEGRKLGVIGGGGLELDVYLARLREILEK